jgi:glucuronoarabinoxylan endo-1,4-beta-xylanase
MGDPAAAAYVGILAFHDYDQAATTPYPFPAQGSTKYWETEVSGAIGFGPSLCGGCWDPSIADAIMWAQVINNRLTVGNINAWHYWLLIGGTTNNEGLIGPEGATIPKRAYMVGNYSKFVRPGFYRIDATPAPQTGIEISAFKNASDGTLVIVAINANTESVTQSFTLNGLTVGSVTPWITSAGLNLAEQSEFEINGSSFTFKLPGSSVTTFVSTSTLAAPTNLTTTVH